MSSSIKEASRDRLTAHHKTYHFYNLARAAEQLGPIDKLPKSMEVLLENLRRHQDGVIVTEAHLSEVAGWLKTAHAEGEIAYRPARVLMQGFTGVPAVVDLAAMREAVKRLGGECRQSESSLAGGSGHRPFGHRGRLRQRGGVCGK